MDRRQAIITSLLLVSSQYIREVVAQENNSDIFQKQLKYIRKQVNRDPELFNLFQRTIRESGAHLNNVVSDLRAEDFKKLRNLQPENSGLTVDIINAGLIALYRGALKTIENNSESTPDFQRIRNSLSLLSKNTKNVIPIIGDLGTELLLKAHEAGSHLNPLEKPEGIALAMMVPTECSIGSIQVTECDDPSNPTSDTCDTKCVKWDDDPFGEDDKIEIPIDIYGDLFWILLAFVLFSGWLGKKLNG